VWGFWVLKRGGLGDMGKREIGFELGLFSRRPPSRLFSYPFVLKVVTFISAFLELGLFCIKKLICRGFFTVVKMVPSL
jgi:hypothetical protein